VNIEIAGVKGRLYWSYDHNLVAHEIADLGLERLLPEGWHNFYETGYIATWATWAPLDTQEDLDPEYSALALCSPQDRFCKETGRKISLKKLLATMGLTQEQRNSVWLQYFDRFN